MKVRWLLISGAVALLILIAVVGLVVYESATLKNRLTESLGRALGARVQITSLSADLWQGEIHAAGITLENLRPEAPWNRGEISQAIIRFHPADLLAPELPLRVEVSSWHLQLRSSPPVASSDGSHGIGTPSPPGTDEHPGRTVRVVELEARQGEVELHLAEDRTILSHDVAFQASDNGARVWTTQLHAGGIEAGSLVAGASSVSLRSDRDEVTFSDMRLRCASGFITGDGKVGLTGPRTSQAKITAVDVPVIMLVGAAWQMKLSGLASGTLNYNSSETGSEALGQLSITQGRFNVIPFLGRMASLVGLPDISGMEVDQATTNFDWKDRALHLTKIDIRKNDVTRIAGDVDVTADGQVDGRLKLGLPDSLLARWPQLQTEVFATPVDGYGWADVHLTGTPDHLKEDLSARVLAAGIEGGNGLINRGTQKAMDLLKGFMGQ